jgi:hypothetical protein
MTVKVKSSGQAGTHLSEKDKQFHKYTVHHVLRKVNTYYSWYNTEQITEWLFAQICFENFSHELLQRALCNQDEGWHRSHMLKGGRMEGNTPKWLRCVYIWACTSRRVSLGLHKSRPTRHGSPSSLPLDPLTHSSPRPGKREQRKEGEDWRKKREQPRSSLLVLELLAFF